MPNIEIEATDWIKDIQEFNLKTENVEDVGTYEYELADKHLEDFMGEINVLVSRYNDDSMADAHRNLIQQYQDEYCGVIGELVAHKLRKNKDYKISKIEVLNFFLTQTVQIKSIGLACSIKVEKPLTQDQRLEKFVTDFNAALEKVALTDV